MNDTMRRLTFEDWKENRREPQADEGVSRDVPLQIPVPAVMMKRLWLNYDLVVPAHPAPHATSQAMDISRPSTPPRNSIIISRPSTPSPVAFTSTPAVHTLEEILNNPDLITHRRSPEELLRSCDGLCGEIIPGEGIFVTSPNMSFVPIPLTFTRVSIRRLHNFGKDDPLFWPQPFDSAFGHLAVIPCPTLTNPDLSPTWPLLKQSSILDGNPFGIHKRANSTAFGQPLQGCVHRVSY
ncbi:hypothetical protein BT96DRAFT_1009368 [Gymnopus androsaceus JB14]|uniref:Uncharacterized protein n=1 Tax=Gymnopus androsaceus JB14 TaxID=1447944 RepID=A0A6A4GCQ3_9AGAR|nr:hypothetical protein BT96DRAFT_1009368 [Gymnopus androsaceus JB14]